MQRRTTKPLNARQRAFADAWAGPGSATAAARAAGYAGGDGTLASAASRMMKDPRVVERIATRLARARVERWRVFAEQYNGPGTEVQAARLAGYEGDDGPLAAHACELLDNARVMERIWMRVGMAQWETWCAAMPPREPTRELEPDDTDEEVAAIAERIEAELVAPVPEPTRPGVR